MIQIDMPMPETCSECRFETECGHCKAMPDNFCGNTDDRKKPEWCPLKEQKEKTGHWVSVNDGDVVSIDNDGFPERACFCSECKKYLIASDEYAVYGRYCPFCGAKMKGR